jgi:hypothetical protein
MQDATIYLCQANPSLSQLRLVPKIGQRGPLMFEGVLLQRFTKITKVQFRYKITIKNERIVQQL